MFDISKMLGNMKEIQAKFKEVQDNLEAISVTSESGAGMVKATINGNKKLINLEIDKDLIKEDDSDMLIDLVIAAVNKAMEDIEAMVKEEYKKNTENILPNIPGLDLSNLTQNL
ncbi:MAG: YbaB/EbfC family nucleoid-associated protein [Bacteroidetes bacterium]|nr:YbaB/EbfC family nucleoid-associated protein [Bacteroidota bacterium]